VQANSQTIRDQPCAATALIAPARLAAVWDSAPGRGRRQRITAGSDADPETVRRPRDVKRAREVRSCRDRPGDPPQLALGRRDPRVSPPGCPRRRSRLPPLAVCAVDATADVRRFHLTIGADATAPDGPRRTRGGRSTAFVESGGRRTSVPICLVSRFISLALGTPYLATLGLLSLRCFGGLEHTGPQNSVSVTEPIQSRKLFRSKHA